MYKILNKIFSYSWSEHWKYEKNHLPNDITPTACIAFDFANIHAFSGLGLK